MALFEYEVIDYSGKRIKGEIESKDRIQAINSLRKSNFTILDLNEVRMSATDKKKGKVKLSEIVIFTRQFAALVKSGIPIIKSLNILFAQVEDHYLKKTISSITTKIESGSSLSNALADYPQIFSPIYINLIKAGEFSGALDVLLDRLAIYLENVSRLNKKIRSAMIYPAVIISVAFIITAVIFLKVIPGFQDIFTSLNATLPLPTLVVINISKYFRHNFLSLVGVGIIGIIGFRKLMIIPAALLVRDRLILNLPIIGKFARKVVIARFTRTLSTLLKSGVAILQALDIVSKASGNKIVEKAILDVKSSISKGEKVGDSMAKTAIFAPLVFNLVSVGEETGDMPTMLDKIATFYEEEVETGVASLTALIEPIIIIFLGVLIGGIVLAMFLPILTLTSIVGR
ncbi:MAG: type II secretion system F family protein [Candidatus Omnitrophota bacterium]